eukprot:c8168_g1_i1.p1 GENE.c8168_g1_i1~~c8168_g1_i1.p1  ORF type:complete len:363 (-),score=91.70 c8168_g1_i1:156-1244(-)
MFRQNLLKELEKLTQNAKQLATETNLRFANAIYPVLRFRPKVEYPTLENVIFQVRDAIDRASGSVEMTAAQKQVTKAEDEFNSRRTSLIQVTKEHEMASHMHEECTRRITEVLQSPGGIANAGNLQLFYNLSKEQIDLKDKEKRLAIEKEHLAELEKLSWNAFTDSLRTSYSQEQTYKEKVRRLTIWASLAGFVIPVFLFEPFKRRKEEKFLQSVFKSHVDQLQVQNKIDVATALKPSETQLTTLSNNLTTVQNNLTNVRDNIHSLNQSTTSLLLASNSLSNSLPSNTQQINTHTTTCVQDAMSNVTLATQTNNYSAQQNNINLQQDTIAQMRNSITYATAVNVGLWAVTLLCVAFVKGGSQ